MRLSRLIQGFATTLALGLAVIVGGQAATARPATDFKTFVEGVWPDAKAAGVSRKTFDAAFKGVEPDYTIPDLDLPDRPKIDNSGQAEFTKTAADYLSAPYLEKLGVQGRAFLKDHEAALKRIEALTSVDRFTLVAIWGRETAYGSYHPPKDAIRMLATLAYTGKRKDKFREELVAALKMLQMGVPRSDMRSSWAGAVGLTQAMPTEYLQFAIDGDGDGKIDIWRSVADALAFTAKQLEGKGWVRGARWGYEVIAPDHADCSLEGPPDARPIADWVRMGFKRAGGKPFSRDELQQEAYLMMPGGAYGPAFLAGQNFRVIRLYNTSDLYALFVGNLSDRIRGGGNFVTPWKNFAQPRTTTVHNLQVQLQKLGYPMDKIDGKIGSNTRKQIGLYQKAARIKIDCWPSDSVLASANAQANR
ncbi:lytic murein transglycosylase [Hyphomicrobium denitrificans ATCC 51888]|uniref:Lytic murein transglycosylase n=1 Tax=Hyphomicrobium denitrificans (strain ATCC 51888 / DSM 1869 / NCIMB 11706 / TK 0415) TaxID=582899 RepID=D8JTD4_HYPDA|nr:lytic murein transglycosylase [Hyphomicrobium denitrificans]ADJ24452.1 lytic murein transglycosylase [Hyphomicrobium denitrificans ATCC 51888]